MNLLTKCSIPFLRFALAASFLSAVADRFGLWGAEGTPGVVWGNVESFLAYTALLNPWAPASLSNFLGYAATILEVVLALFLVIGFKTKLTAFGSFALLMIFGLSMVFVFGVKAPLDYSVFTAAAASLLLYKECKNV